MAIFVLAALVFAAPVGALAAPQGPADGSGVTPPTIPPPGGSSTTSTTTAPATPSTDSSKPTVSTPSAPVDHTPTAGPPELAKAGMLLPNDSVIAAIEELALERSKVDLIGKRQTALDAAIVAHEAQLEHVRRLRKQQQAQRVDRAVATYRGQSSGWQLGVITDRGLTHERALYLVAAADAATRDKIKTLLRTADKLDLQLKAERAERIKVGAQLNDAVARVNRLLDKLAASNGAIALIDGVLTFVPAGPSAIAVLADAADQQLSRLLATNAPPATDVKWIDSSHALAMEIARSKGVSSASAAALEASWAATPPNVVHAVLFALRQVGKAYVYATGGPVTFDCSGLTKAAYAQLHLGLPHFSGAQLHIGTPVAAPTLRPGDLLAYGTDGSEHVAMFIGDGLVVEAKGRAYGVIVAPARTDPANGFAGATRIVP